MSETTKAEVQRLKIPHSVVVAAVGIGLAAIAAVVQNAYYLHIAFMITVYLLCAMGMNVLVGYAGQKSLGQAGLFAAGAYTVAVLTTRFNFDPWLSFGLAALVSGVFGVIIALPSLRVKGPYLAMVTLAFGIVVEKVATEWTDVLGGSQGIFNIKPLSIGGTPLTTLQWVWFGIFLCVVMHIMLRNLLTGRFGRALLSLQIDEIAAASLGVNIYRYKVLSFVIAAVACGLAGAMVAQKTMYFNTDFVSFQLSIFILLLVLFGGSGLIYGPVTGTVILVITDSLLAKWPPVQHLVYGSALLFALYVLPRGMAGLLARLIPDSKRSAPALLKVAGNSGSSKLPCKSATGGGATLLEIRGVSKAYGGVKPAQNIEVKLSRGHIHALIGPNGAGKSTLINMVTGIVPPDSGTIYLNNIEITGMTATAICRSGIARTFQNLRLFTDMTVLDNILVGCHGQMKNGFWSSLLNLPRAAREEGLAKLRAQEIMDYLGLTHHADSLAGSLSYGLQRRVELARGIATAPDLLLIDEPAAGLNPQETAELGETLKGICKSGITILMVEHHMDLVMSISDHITVLDYGIKIAEGSPATVQNDPQVIAAYLGVEDTEDQLFERVAA